MARYKMLPKMGKHYFRQDGRTVCVKPGDIIDTEECELRGAKDKFVRLDPPTPEPEPTRGLYPKHAGGGRWNVINEATGNPINDELLSKEEAQALVDKGLGEDYDAGTGDGQAAGGDPDNKG